MTETEVHFEGRTPSRATQIASAQATVIACHKMLQEALHGDPAQADGNVKCATYWLRLAASNLEALLKPRMD